MWPTTISVGSLIGAAGGGAIVEQNGDGDLHTETSSAWLDLVDAESGSVVVGPGIDPADPFGSIMVLVGDTVLNFRAGSARDETDAYDLTTWLKNDTGGTQGS